MDPTAALVDGDPNAHLQNSREIIPTIMLLREWQSMVTVGQSKVKSRWAYSS